MTQAGVLSIPSDVVTFPKRVSTGFRDAELRIVAGLDYDFDLHLHLEGLVEMLDTGSVPGTWSPQEVLFYAQFYENPGNPVIERRIRLFGATWSLVDFGRTDDEHCIHGLTTCLAVMVDQLREPAPGDRDAVTLFAWLAGRREMDIDQPYLGIVMLLLALSPFSGFSDPEVEGIGCG